MSKTIDQIQNVCHDCGMKYGEPRDAPVGVWIADCDICGAMQMECVAPRDYKYLRRLK